MDTAQKGSAVMYLLMFIGFVVVLNIFFFSNAGKPVKNPVIQAADPMEWAGVYAQINVEQNLKSPSTAEFPSLRGSVEDLGDGRYEVSSYVDSQNSFGAMVRSSWEATMKFFGGDAKDAGSWKVEKLVFDGETIYQAP